MFHAAHYLPLVHFFLNAPSYIFVAVVNRTKISVSTLQVWYGSYQSKLSNIFLLHQLHIQLLMATYVALHSYIHVSYLWTMLLLRSSHELTHSVEPLFISMSWSTVAGQKRLRNSLTPCSFLLHLPTKLKMVPTQTCRFILLCTIYCCGRTLY